MASAVQILMEQFTESSANLVGLLDGISEEELGWMPTAGCWTVHHRSSPCEVPADGSGDWVIDYLWPDPEPAPVTTIAWRAVHVGSVNLMYWEYAFGAGRLTFPELELPAPMATDVVSWLRDGQERLVRALTSLNDAGLDEARRTNWGEEWPTRQLFKTLVNEQVHHGAEIALLKDLYRNRETLGRA